LHASPYQSIQIKCFAFWDSAVNINELDGIHLEQCCAFSI
jgi:hypothetical protein